MKIGDVVIPRTDPMVIGCQQTVLACGSGIYTHAICVSLEPFILISESADMRWSYTVDKNDYTALCQAHPDIVKRCLDRLDRDKETGHL